MAFFQSKYILELSEGVYRELKGYKTMMKEITIQFTEKCNVSCPFCFAPIKSEAMLSENDYIEFYRFCEQEQDIDVIHITGGEPTLNPNFGKYISELSKLASIVVYTNFLKSGVVEDMDVKDTQDVVFLVNINSQIFGTEEQKKAMIQNIETALERAFRVALSYTFYDASVFIEAEFEYLIGMMKKYHIRNLRLSQAMSFDENRKFYDRDDVKKLYHYVAQNIMKWKREGLNIYFDCPIPPCSIDNHDFIILRENGVVSVKCLPKVYVMWNLNVTHCYSTMNGEARSLTEFRNLAEANAYTIGILQKLYEDSYDKRCGQCIHGEDKIPCGCPSWHI